jgi:hypothetical protein
MNKSKDTAIKVLGDALRQKFSNDSKLSNLDLIIKYDTVNQLNRLTSYFEKLQKSLDILQQTLLNT